MKKILLAIAIVATLLVGCTKNEDNPEKINIVFSVDDKAAYGAETKALKEFWDTNDEILILFEEQGTLIDPSMNNNTVLLCYDGEEWYVSNDDINSLQFNEGTFTAIHHPGSIMLSNKTDNKYYLQNYKGGEYLTFQGEWKLQGTTLNLGKIRMNRKAEMFQISVMDLAEEGGNWTMSIMNDKGAINGVNILHMNNDCKFYVHNHLGTTRFNLDYYSHEKALGIKMGNDVVFSFWVITEPVDVNFFEIQISNGTYTLRNQLPSSATLEGGKAYVMPAIDYESKWQ